MRSALPVAAAVGASVARPEPAVVWRIGLPERRTLLARWLAQGNLKGKVTSSVLGSSRLILLRRGRIMAHGSARSLFSGQVSGTYGRERTKREWTRRMVALTGDFHIVASCVTTSFSAVFFSISHFAKTWYVRAYFRILIRHSIPSFQFAWSLQSKPCDPQLRHLGWLHALLQTHLSR